MKLNDYVKHCKTTLSKSVIKGPGTLNQNLDSRPKNTTTQVETNCTGRNPQQK